MFEGHTLVLVPSRKGRTPEHLVPYHEAFRQAAREAADATKHLKGERRVAAMNDYIRRKLKKPDVREPQSNG